MHRVVISGPAERALSRINHPVQRRIVQAIERLGQDLNRKANVKKLVGSEFYRLRVGDYRVIFMREDQNELIRIITIGHRREVYR